MPLVERDPLPQTSAAIGLVPFNAAGVFLTPAEDPEGGLRRKAVRGAGATIFAGCLTLVIQVTATMVLARLLAPADFGVVAMVTTFSLLLVNFGFNGLTEAIIQREDVSHALASTLFWISLGFGLLLTAAFAAAGPLLAHFYHNPRVQPVTVGVALSIFLTSISTVHLALLKRAMWFSWISANDIAARAASVAISILLGCLGYGVWALVIGVLVVPVSTAIGAFLLCHWLPGPPRRSAGTRGALLFATHTYLNYAVGYSSRNVDNLLVGWRFDAASLGFYKKAYDLFALSANQLVTSIAVVVLAALSRVRSDAVLYRRYLLNALGIMAFVGMGVGAVLTIIGRDLIFVLLGPRWGPAGQIFTFFGPGIGVMILYATQSWIHLSAGRPDRWFRWSILEFFITLLLLMAGLHYGPSGIAIAWSTSYWILTLPAIWYAGIPDSLGIASVIATIWKFVVASMATFPATLLVIHHLPWLTAWSGIPGALLRIVVSTAIETAFYFGVVTLLHRGTAPLTQIFDLLGEVVRHRTQSGDAPAAAKADEEAAVQNFSFEPSSPE